MNTEVDLHPTAASARKALMEAAIAKIKKSVMGGQDQPAVKAPVPNAVPDPMAIGIPNPPPAAVTPVADPAAPVAVVPNPAPLRAAAATGEGFRSEVKTQAEKDEEDLRRLTQNTYDSPEVQAERERIATSSPLFQQQAQGIKNEEALLRAMPRRPAQMPMQDLDAFASFMSDGAYKAPARPAQPDPNKQIMDYYAKLQDDKRDMYKSVLTSMTGQRSGTTMVQDMLKQKQLVDKIDEISKRIPGAGGGTKDPSVKAARFINLVKTDPTYQDAVKSLNGSRLFIQKFSDSSSKPSWLLDRTLQASVLQAMKMYPISDRDAASVTGGPGLVEKMESMVHRLSENENFRPEDRQIVLDYLGMAGELNNGIVTDAVNRVAGGAAAEFGYTPAQAQRLAGVMSVSTHTGGPKEGAPSTKKGKYEILDPKPRADGKVRVKETASGQTGWLLPKDAGK